MVCRRRFDVKRENGLLFFLWLLLAVESDKCWKILIEKICRAILIALTCHFLRNSGSDTLFCTPSVIKWDKLTMWSISSWIVATGVSSIFQWIKCSHVRRIDEAIATVAWTATSATLMTGACIRRTAQPWIVVPSRLGCRCHIHNHRSFW